MYHRYPYDSFAEYSNIIINACVVGTSGGNKEKNLFGFGQRFILPQAAICDGFSVIAKQIQAEIRDYYLLIVNR